MLICDRQGIGKTLRIPDLQQPKNTLTDSSGMLAGRISVVGPQAPSNEEEGGQRNAVVFHRN
jgi:hypothetical protein